MESNHDDNNVTPVPISVGARSVAGYEIRVKDHLDPCWWHWFEGWTVTNLDNGEVLLRSASVDQSALHGALNKIRDLNLTLLSVFRERTQSDKGTEKGKPQ